MNEFPVTTSLQEAAAEILKHSFAIYQAPESIRPIIQQAWDDASKVLDQPESSIYNMGDACNGSLHNAGSSNHNHQLPQRIINGHLHGYNTPSNAKRLFRVFPSNEQPWPLFQNHSTNGKQQNAFRSSSEKVAEALHEILARCCQHIINANASTPATTSTTTNLNKHPCEPLRKRQRTSIMSTSSTMHNNKNIDTATLITTTTTTTKETPLGIPLTWKEATNCPLDYFFYHNQRQDTVNCSEHVDRGLLICVCLTDVPGLEVSPQNYSDTNNTNNFIGGNLRFVCPEESIAEKRLYQELAHPTSDGRICIMAGDQLSQHIGKRISCIHRVRNRLKRARLSISYELRL